MARIIQISTGILFITVVSLTYWEFGGRMIDSSSDVDEIDQSSHSSSLPSPYRVFDGLKYEINQNVHKFHEEMGIAEWIIYFSYIIMGFVTLFLAIIFCLLLLKVHHNSKKFIEISTQTDDQIELVANILQDLLIESDSTIMNKNEETNIEEDSGINLVKDELFEEVDSKCTNNDCGHHQSPPHGIGINYNNNSIDLINLHESSNLQEAVGEGNSSTLEINFVKSTPPGIILSSTFILKSMDSLGDVVIFKKYYSTTYLLEVGSY